MNLTRRIAAHPSDDVFNAYMAGWHSGQTAMFISLARYYTFLSVSVRQGFVQLARHHWHDYLRCVRNLPSRQRPLVQPVDDLAPVLKASIIDLAERRAAKELTP